MLFLNHIINMISTFWTEINELIIFSHYVQCAGSPQMSFCLRSLWVCVSRVWQDWLSPALSSWKPAIQLLWRWFLRCDPLSFLSMSQLWLMLPSYALERNSFHKMNSEQHSIKKYEPNFGQISLAFWFNKFVEDSYFSRSTSKPVWFSHFLRYVSLFCICPIHSPIYSLIYCITCIPFIPRETQTVPAWKELHWQIFPFKDISPLLFKTLLAFCYDNYLTFSCYYQWYLLSQLGKSSYFHYSHVTIYTHNPFFPLPPLSSCLQSALISSEKLLQVNVTA